MSNNANKGTALDTMPSGSLADIASADGFGVDAWKVERDSADILAVGVLSSNMDGVTEYLRGVAAFNAISFGNVGEGKAFGKRSDLQTALGLSSAGQLSRAELIGRAAVVHGVKPGTARWTRITRATRASGPDASAVKDALRSEKVTMRTLDSLLDALDKPAALPAGDTGSNAPVPGESTPGTDTGNGSGRVTREDASKATPAARRQMIRECLSIVSTVVDVESDRDTLTDTLERLTTLAADVQARLAETDADESKTA